MNEQRRRVLHGMAASVLLPVSAAPAFARPRAVPLSLDAEWENAQPLMRTARLEVSVLRQGGRIPFPIFRGPDDTSYVGGADGAVYRLMVRNRTGSRLLVVPSVDGLNAITGQVAHPGQSGYILEPYGEVMIDGWRKSMLEVARFEFSAPASSYAARVGKGANVGVIGFAVFDEHRPAPLAYDAVMAQELHAAPAGDPRAMAKSEARMLSESASAQSLGTGHGARSESRAVQGSFVRASDTPLELVKLRYETVESLVARGIARRARRSDPEPFPGFVPDPPPRR